MTGSPSTPSLLLPQTFEIMARTAERPVACASKACYRSYKNVHSMRAHWNSSHSGAHGPLTKAQVAVARAQEKSHPEPIRKPKLQLKEVAQEGEAGGGIETASSSSSDSDFELELDLGSDLDEEDALSTQPAEEEDADADARSLVRQDAVVGQSAAGGGLYVTFAGVDVPICASHREYIKADVLLAAMDGHKTIKRLQEAKDNRADLWNVLEKQISNSTEISDESNFRSVYAECTPDEVADFMGNAKALWLSVGTSRQGRVHWFHIDAAILIAGRWSTKVASEQLKTYKKVLTGDPRVIGEVVANYQNYTGREALAQFVSGPAGTDQKVLLANMKGQLKRSQEALGQSKRECKRLKALHIQALQEKEIAEGAEAQALQEKEEAETAKTQALQEKEDAEGRVANLEQTLETKNAEVAALKEKAKAMFERLAQVDLATGQLNSFPLRVAPVWGITGATSGDKDARIQEIMRTAWNNAGKVVTLVGMTLHLTSDSLQSVIAGIMGVSDSDNEAITACLMLVQRNNHVRNTMAMQGIFKVLHPEVEYSTKAPMADILPYLKSVNDWLGMDPSTRGFILPQVQDMEWIGQARDNGMRHPMQGQSKINGFFAPSSRRIQH